MDFKTKKKLYSDNFGLYFSDDSLMTKFKVIGLICFLYDKLREKKPGLTYYELIQTINKPTIIPDSYAEGLAIVCEDFAYNCKEFPNFGLNTNEMVPTLKELLRLALPF